MKEIENIQTIMKVKCDFYKIGVNVTDYQPHARLCAKHLS